ncbi:MAG: NIPSNAP family protein [Verrucomicrobiales bacterium]|nr:NIPSNAP family protein [Verrucomicrobiales bacterium]
MFTRLLLAATAALCLGTFVSAPAVAAASAPADTRCYELRIYHTAPGKLDDLHQRFRNHTLALFEKHRIQSLGYWVPIQNTEDTRLFFLLSYPSRADRDASWKAFMDDPAWQAAYKASEANGPLVVKVEQMFLSATDYSPAIQTGTAKARRVFEFRDYTASPGNLGHLNARFRDHTVELFAKHGMQNWGYWTPMAGEPGADNRLVYLLGHASTDAAKASFAAFGQDPRWKTAREASEKAGGGSLTAPGGVKSTFLAATDYSPTR